MALFTKGIMVMLGVLAVFVYEAPLWMHVASVPIFAFYLWLQYKEFRDIFAGKKKWSDISLD